MFEENSSSEHVDVDVDVDVDISIDIDVDVGECYESLDALIISRIPRVP